MSALSQPHPDYGKSNWRSFLNPTRYTGAAIATAQGNTTNPFRTNYSNKEIGMRTLGEQTRQEFEQPQNTGFNFPQPLSFNMPSVQAPQVNLTGTSLNTGGGGGGFTQQAPSQPTNSGPTLQEQRAAEEEAARQAAIRNLGASRNSIRDQSRGNLNQFRTQFSQDSRDFVNQIQDQQDQLNRDKASNAHNFNSTIDAISRAAQMGLRSGGVALAGMNASDSGAVDAMGRAYANASNQQVGEANAQYGDVLDDLMRGQSQLNRSRDTGFSDLEKERQGTLDAERLWLNNQLTQLDNDSRAQGLDWRADRGMVDNIVNQALSRLSSIGEGTQGQLDKINPWDGDRITEEAMKLREAGQPGRQFQFSRPGVQFGSGAAMPGSQMPLFARNREDFAPVLPGRGNEERR